MQVTIFRHTSGTKTIHNIVEHIPSDIEQSVRKVFPFRVVRKQFKINLPTEKIRWQMSEDVRRDEVHSALSVSEMSKCSPSNHFLFDKGSLVLLVSFLTSPSGPVHNRNKIKSKVATVVVERCSMLRVDLSFTKGCWRSLTVVFVLSCIFLLLIVLPVSKCLTLQFVVFFT